MRGDLLRNVYPEMRYMLRAGWELKQLLMLNPGFDIPSTYKGLILEIEAWNSKLQSRKDIDDRFQHRLHTADEGVAVLRLCRDGEDVPNLRRMLPTVLKDWQGK